MSDANDLLGLQVNPVLLEAVSGGTKIGLEMAGVVPQPVGASKFPKSNRRISVLVGLLGSHTGTMNFNLSERAALLLAGKLLGEEQSEFDEETLDAIAEFGNMIAGGIKSLCAENEFGFTNLSCPTVVMGARYDLYYSRGFTTVSVDFELEEISVVHMKDRCFSVSVSLMKR